VTLFLCESNISGTAERIYDKFIRKTCLVPRSDEFEYQGQRSRSTGTKTHCALPSPPAATEWNALPGNNVMQQQTGPFRRCRGRLISAACVRFMFGKTSLALVQTRSRSTGTKNALCTPITSGSDGMERARWKYYTTPTTHSRHLRLISQVTLTT